MGDHKVHPVPPPSAPPASHSRHSSLGTQSSMSSIALQMPDEPALRKEQEQSLMRSDEEAPNVPQKDFIYKMPQPLPADHPSVRQARKAGRRERGRGCCGRSWCCCCGILLAIVAAIVLVLGLTALVLYLVLQPKAPDFSVTGASISAFDLSPQPSSPANAVDGASFYLSADVTFNVTAENPNKRIGIYYDAIHVTLFYQEQQIGEGSIPAFYNGHRNTTLLALSMKGQDVGLTQALGDGLRTTLANADSSIGLRSRTIADVRFKVGSWKSRTWTFDVNCNVEMSNPTAPNPRLLSKSCSFKVKSFKI